MCDILPKVVFALRRANQRREREIDAADLGLIRVAC